MNYRPLLVLAFILSAFIILSVPGLADSNVTFADTNLVNCQILVYEYNGTLLGIYNSTDNGVYIPTNAMVVFKPASTDFIKNPLLLPELVINFLGPITSFFVLIFVIAAGWFIFFRHR